MYEVCNSQSQVIQNIERGSVHASRVSRVDWGEGDPCPPPPSGLSKHKMFPIIRSVYFHHLKGTLPSGEFSKSLANKQEAVGAYFASSFIEQ